MYFSSNGIDWTQVGQDINCASIDSYTDSNFQIWEGTQQGLYVIGQSADFDLYIYRDAYSPIMAQPAANQYGTLRVVSGRAPAYLDSIDHNDGTLYAGVEFGCRENIPENRFLLQFQRPVLLQAERLRFGSIP